MQLRTGSLDSAIVLWCREDEEYQPDDNAEDEDEEANSEEEGAGPSSKGGCGSCHHAHFLRSLPRACIPAD